jgi:UDP-N-acetylmuramyl pentapeptide phosphotransferase/UDP-N-acetylglucosamine-1-phosphate transferase
VAGAVFGAVLGAVAARAAYAAFKRRPPLGDEKTAEEYWTRTNHRGEPVTLLEGPAFVAGAGAAIALAPGVPARLKAAGMLAGVGSGVLGAYDDVFGTTSSKGFKGHLAALSRGEVTSGAVKILGIGATGLAAAVLSPATARNGARMPGVVSRTFGTLVDGALIAGSANLANLFDLRPGRAIKVGLLAGIPLVAASARANSRAATLAAIPLGAAVALLPEDLGERAMLGDSGANALGALLGLAATVQLGRPGRLVLLGTVAALTAASEKISFTKVIAGNPVLNRLDMLGRRPPQAPAGTARPTA